MACARTYMRSMPFFSTLLFLLCAVSLSSVPTFELDALRSLYNDTHGDDWNWRSETSYGPIWNFSSYPDVDPCNYNGKIWQGLTCSALPNNCSESICHIIAINLQTYDLYGTLPSIVSNLRSLTLLHVGDNSLTGNVPTELGSLSNLLGLILQENDFTGSLPVFSSTLAHLDIYYNTISGALPIVFDSYPQLQFLRVVNNPLTGTLPDSMCELPLVSLYLDSTLIHGPIPTCIGRITKLELFIASDTTVDGEIPSQIGFLQKLTYLALFDSLVSGTLPSELGNCSDMSRFDASNTFIHGSIPSELGKWTSLVDLRLSSAGLSGPLLSDMGLWSSARSKLDLSNNCLTGTLPTSLGTLTKLPSLLLSENQFTGTIPSEIGNLKALKYLYLNDNFLNGTIPTTVQTLDLLESLYLQDNDLTGPIPAAIGNITRLVYVYLQDNSLTGPIPSELGLLRKLYRIGLSVNLLTGRLPDSLGTISVLHMLAADGNFLTGPLPNKLGTWKRLEMLRIGSNALTGPLFAPPSNAFLYILDVQYNFLTGTLPKSFAALENLVTMTVNNNLLTGPLPSEFFRATDLMYLKVGYNHFTGTLPQDLGATALLEMNIQHNSFTGTLPSSIGNLTSLQVLIATGNQLTGHMNHILWQPKLMTIEVIDMSDNRLDGTIPNTLFDLPNLRVLALTYNCLHGELPKSMCNASGMDVLSLDGLSAQRNCEYSKNMPFISVQLNRKLSGTIPDCIFQLPSLQALQLSGNGLSGTISDIPATARLVNMSLSHNRLSGTIPLSVRARHWMKLDLSYNKLQGQCSHFAESADNESFVLDVNRLSGRYPRNLLGAKKTSVLSENLFSCEGSPSSDSSTDEYSCGSTELDASLYTLSEVLGFFIMIGTLLLVCIHWDVLKGNAGIMRLISSCEEIFNDVRCCDACVAIPGLPQLSALNSLLGKLPWFACLVMCIGMACCIPVYTLKLTEVGSDSTEYATHSHLYAWTVSMVYVTGQLPAAQLVAGGLCSLFAVTRGWLSVPLSNSVEGVHMGANSASAKVTDTIHSSLSLYGLLLLNICLLGTVNTLYIFSTLRTLSRQSRLFIQFGMAAFKACYGSVIVPSCSAALIANPLDKTWFKVAALLFSGIVAPAIVTVFTSPSCFQGLLVDPEPINSAYSYFGCTATVQLGSKFSCVQYSDIAMEVIPVTPPLTYNYMCTSVLLAAYVPVYLYVYSLNVVLLIGMPLVFRHWTNMPTFIQRLEHGILWPDRWTAENHSSWHLLKAHAIVSTYISHLAVLLTFGLFYPVLGVVVMLTCALYSLQMRWMLGGFIRHRLLALNPTVKGASTTNSERNAAIGVEARVVFGQDPAMQCLERNAVGWTQSVDKCLWLLCGTVSMFYMVSCWDMAGDESGWKGGIWVPVLVICFMCLMVAYVKYVRSDSHILVWSCLPFSVDTSKTCRADSRASNAGIVMDERVSYLHARSTDGTSTTQHTGDDDVA